jgi:hypothetical protein
MRVLLVILTVLFWHVSGHASAQCLGMTDAELLAATLDAPPGQTRGIATGAAMTHRGERGSATGFGLPVTIRRPPGSVPAWDQLRFIGAARSVERMPHPAREVPSWIERILALITFSDPFSASVRFDYARAAVGVELIERTADEVRLRILTPERTKRAIVSEEWFLVAVGCSADNNIVLHAAVRTTLYDWGFAVVLTLVVLILGWAFLAHTAWKRNAARLQRAWLVSLGGNPDLDDEKLRDWAKNNLAASKPYWGEAPAAGISGFWDGVHARRLRWKLLHAADPVFISQDGLGDASLGRVQLLVFSVVVAALLFYVWLRTGVIVGFSQDLLVLLGITGAGTALSRLAIARNPVSPQTHALLLRLGVVNVNRNMPRWSGVISSDGEVDVTRVQALAFSIVVLVALVFTGVSDLVNFQLSDQVKWLLGISQGVYIAGKLVPSEACQRLDTEVNEMIKAAREERAGVEGAAQRFKSGREGASRTLLEVYGPRADLARFNAATALDVA